MGLFSRSKKVKQDGPHNVLPLAPPSQMPPSQLPPPQLPSQAQHGWHEASYQAPPPFQPAGLLPPPPGWSPSPQAPASYQQGRPPYAPIIVNQYYLSPPAPPQQQQRPPTSNGPPSKWNLGSVVDLAEGICPRTGIPQLFNARLPPWNGPETQWLDHGAALYDQLSAKFDDVMTAIDRDRYIGNEKDLFIWQPDPDIGGPASEPSSTDRGFTKKPKKERDHSKGQPGAIASTVISSNYFSKVELYANSRLPMDLPPLRLYIPTYPLLCLAAQYSNRAYEQPNGAEKETHFNADWRNGTKAMVIKSVPMDYMNTIVFAIRGTATFMDWAVNLNMAPASPVGFLDDPGNFCHAGFLSVARRMVNPVAKRLRQLLQEDPGRSAYSLLITGHSAGGAIASLLYSHMLATSREAESELNILTGCFKRVHCVTFGTPPVSLLPLMKPNRPELRKSLFLSFVNEGDPVARADPAYIRALLTLYASPPPSIRPDASSSSMALSLPGKRTTGGRTPKNASKTSLASTKTGKSSSGKSSAKQSFSTGTARTASTAPIFRVPPCTLSNAGRIVVLRSGDARARVKGKKTVEERLNEGVVAQFTTDEQLRTVVWGDPVCHLMKLYAGRIETIAVGAVTAQGH